MLGTAADPLAESAIGCTLHWDAIPHRAITTELGGRPDTVMCAGCVTVAVIPSPSH